MALNDDDLKARMNRFVPPTAAILGQEILEIDSAAGRVKMKFQPIDACRNPMGNVQGGIVVAMLDDAAAFAAIIKSGKRIGIHRSRQILLDDFHLFAFFGSRIGTASLFVDVSRLSTLFHFRAQQVDDLIIAQRNSLGASNFGVHDCR